MASVDEVTGYVVDFDSPRLEEQHRAAVRRLSGALPEDPPAEAATQAVAVSADGAGAMGVLATLWAALAGAYE